MIIDLGDVSESRLCWPDNRPRAAQRTTSAFQKTEVGSEQRGIEAELERWRIRQFIISRNNQRIFAGDPGVAVWWTDRRTKDLRALSCDKYQKLSDNMHAIRLTLQAMRALERWGAYTSEQAAEGAKVLALPPPEGGDWRKAFGVTGAIYGHLPKDQQLILCESFYRRASREANGDEAKQRVLNLAIEAARLELATP